MNIAVLSTKASLYSTRRLLAAGEQRGHRMRLINHMKCNIFIENGCPTVLYKNTSLEDLDAIIPRIGSSVTEYGAAVIRQFEMMQVLTPTHSDGLLRARNKLKSLQLLSMSGLNLPKTIFTNYSKDVDYLIQSVGGVPLIIKLLEGSQGLGVVLAEHYHAAESIINAFNKLKAKIIVQEFIQEARGVDLRALVVGGKVIAAMKRTARAGDFRANLHRGGTAEAIDLTEEEADAAIRATQVMGLHLSGVDILPTERGPLILEVNASPGLEGIEGVTGIDIAAEVIRYLEKIYATHDYETPESLPH